MLAPTEAAMVAMTFVEWDCMIGLNLAEERDAEGWRALELAAAATGVGLGADWFPSSGRISSSLMFDRSDSELVPSGLIGDGVEFGMVKLALGEVMDGCSLVDDEEDDETS